MKFLATLALLFGAVVCKAALQDREFTVKDALKELNDATIQDDDDDDDKLDISCCQKLKKRGSCKDKLALEICPRTCGCIDQISYKSCHILKANAHCGEKTIASACRETCGTCGVPKSGKSCRAIKQKYSRARDGVYNINPSGGKNSFKAYCDMTTNGGGWTMCYTANNRVNPRTETTYNPVRPYGTNGYRTNCNDLEFTEILFVDVKSKQTVNFKRKTGTALKVSSNYGDRSSTSGLFEARGVASSSIKYQLLICNTSFYRGFFVSGYTNCWKRCNSWCGDTRTAYFRTASSSSSYNGVAFNTNGHRPLNNAGSKLMSVGLR